MRQRRPRSPYDSAQSDQDISCPLAEPLNTIECVNREQMPGLDFAHAWNKSEYVHFAHSRKHLFAWRGQNSVAPEYGVWLGSALFVFHLDWLQTVVTKYFFSYNQFNNPLK